MSNFFYGCYLLVSRSDNFAYKGRTYIGFTVDPRRRVKQHNAGMKSGGARQTSNRGPWDMILVVHGFPNEISALRFEWAWQHPQDSRRLQSIISKKNAKEKQPMYKLRVLNEMLNCGPWDRLCLSVCWLKKEYAQEFPFTFLPPSHIRITFECLPQINQHKITVESSDEKDTLDLCHECVFCSEVLLVVDDCLVFNCTFSECLARFHITCLAKKSFEKDNKFLIPISVHCPKCYTSMYWSDLVKRNTTRLFIDEK